MSGVLWFVLWIALVYLLYRSRRTRIGLEEQEREIRELSREVDTLRGEIERLARRPEPAAPEAQTEPPKAVRPFVFTSAPAVAPAVLEPSAPAPLPPRAPAPPPPPPAPKAPGRLERLVMENWTGILGAVVVVAGVTFVGIYTALRLDPFYRFLMTLAAAGALLGVSRWLASKEAWREFSAWLRSAGAAILLFACAASGGLPGLGLQWIHAPLPGLGLLVAGIVINLYLAYAVGRQEFATLHVLLNLVPLAIVPASTVSLGIASAVCLFAVTLGARERWDRHLALVLAGYLLFHVFWAAVMGYRLQAEAARMVAALCTGLVFGGAVLVHHRKRFAAREAVALQLAVHLAAWGLLALAMFAYLPSSLSRGVVLLALGAVAYGLGQRARARELPWLQRADTLAAQAAVLLALVSGYDLGASVPLLLLVAFAETLAFRMLVPRGQDAVLDRVADALPGVAGALLLLSGFGQFHDRPQTLAERTVVPLAGALAAVLGQRVLRTSREDPPAGFLQLAPGPEAHPLAGVALGWLAGALVFGALFAMLGRAWMEGAALAAVGALLYAMRRTRVAGLALGALGALAGAQLLGWFDVLPQRHLPALEMTLRFAPLVGLAALGASLAGAGLVRLIAIALIGLDLALGAYVYFEPVSSLIPGVAWLLLSLAALETADRLPRRESVTVLGLGYAYLAAFAANYALVVVQSPAYLGPVRARLLIELFALGVLAYWWFFRPRSELAGHRSWLALHPAFLELLLGGAALCVVLEVDSRWWAVVWATIALGLLSALGERLLDARARAYSLAFYWVSVADVAAVMSVVHVPALAWYQRPEATSLVAIGLQVLYVAWAQRRLALDALQVPWRWLPGVAARIGARRNLFVYYPLFAGIAVYLYWRFDRSLLTLLWSAEAFVVFVLSAWLRENQFRYVALAALGGCLLRLVVVDMAEANLGLRGLVFIGVGLLMLGMNAIYNRFRARFEP